MDKSQVTSGLFGLITAKLEAAHDASIIGQGRSIPDEGKKAAINELKTYLDEVEILLSAIELIGSPS